MSKKKKLTPNTNQHHNIIVPKDKIWHGHQIARDGKDIKDGRTAERKEKEKKIINEQYSYLRDRGYKCDVKHDSKMENAKPAIVGMHKGDPFVVYVKFILKGKNEWCAMVTTRYKGEDTDLKPPYEVLK